MKKTNRLVPTLVSLLLALAPVAQAQKLPDADTREVTAYTLTDAGFAKYSEATHNLTRHQDRRLLGQ